MSIIQRITLHAILCIYLGIIYSFNCVCMNHSTTPKLSYSLTSENSKCCIQTLQDPNRDWINGEYTVWEIQTRELNSRIITSIIELNKGRFDVCQKLKIYPTDGFNYDVACEILKDAIRNREYTLLKHFTLTLKANHLDLLFLTFIKSPKDQDFEYNAILAEIFGQANPSDAAFKQADLYCLSDDIKNAEIYVKKGECLKDLVSIARRYKKKNINTRTASVIQKHTTSLLKQALFYCGRYQGNFRPSLDIPHTNQNHNSFNSAPSEEHLRIWTVQAQELKKRAHQYNL